MTPKQEIDHFLKTGEHTDLLFSAWPGQNVIEKGQNVIEKGQNGKQTLVRGLVAVTVRRAAERPALPPPTEDPTETVRSRLRPMVEGLLPRAVHASALDLLVGSIVFVLPSTIERVLHDETWLNTSWKVANLYLGSVGAKLLSKAAPEILGMSAGGKSYVTGVYLTESGKFDDFVVHECAHTLHDTKRRAVGLAQTRRKEWLVEIEYRKREAFAYACERFSRISVLGRGPRERLALVDEHAKDGLPTDDRVDHDEYLDVLREAAAARNGWKRILARCAPTRARSAT